MSTREWLLLAVVAGIALWYETRKSASSTCVANLGAAGLGPGNVGCAAICAVAANPTPSTMQYNCGFQFSNAANWE